MKTNPLLVVALILALGLTPVQLVSGLAAAVTSQPNDSPEPVVAFGTHHGALWTLTPQTPAGGDTTFHWTWDSEGIPTHIRSVAFKPYPDGAHDYYAVVAGGGLLRRRAQDDAARWIGPGVPGETGWLGYGAWTSGAVDVDRLHGDVVCAALGFVGPAALGQAGVYCSYNATAITPTLQRVDEGLDLIGWFGSRLVVLPRPAGFSPAQTALVVARESEVWRYVWDGQASQMVWIGPESLPITNTYVVSAHLYPRPGDADRFTVFFVTADVGCLTGGGNECANGLIFYRDFDRLGAPLGDWGQLDPTAIAAGCGIQHNLIWDAPTSTARWLTDWPTPTQEAILFSGGAWNAGALGGYTARCLARVQPGDAPGDPYEIVGFPSPALADSPVGAASLAPSPDAADGWRLYVPALKPSTDPALERILVDVDILYSDDYGDTFARLLTVPNLDPAALGDLAVAPGWRRDESGARGLYLGPFGVLSTSGGIQYKLLPGADGGNSTMFGSGVTAAGLQVTGLHVRAGNAGRWQSAPYVAPHAVAVGRRRVYFSLWPASRAPGLPTDGGGVYAVDPADVLQHAALGDGSIPAFEKVWDPATQPCTITVPTNPTINPPPIAHYIAVDPREELVFAILRTADAGLDSWANPAGCGNGLWVGQRPAAPGQPWTWKLLLREDDTAGFKYLWTVSDLQGNFRELIVGLAESTALRRRFQQPFLRVFHDDAGWRHEEVNLGLDATVPITTCRGAGLAYDPLEPNYWVMTVACGQDVERPEGTRSFLRLSTNAGDSFTPWGAGSYENRSLGATVLYRYPAGARRLFVHAREEGVMVQTDPQDPGSLALNQDGLGRLSVTTGASAINLLWPPPPYPARAYLPLVLKT